jgi:hypothetical protein
MTIRARPPPPCREFVIRPGTRRPGRRRAAGRCRRSSRSRRSPGRAWLGQHRSSRSCKSGRGTVPPACPGSDRPEAVSLVQSAVVHLKPPAGSRSRRAVSKSSTYSPA